MSVPPGMCVASLLSLGDRGSTSALCFWNPSCEFSHLAVHQAAWMPAAVEVLASMFPWPCSRGPGGSPSWGWVALENMDLCCPWSVLCTDSIAGCSEGLELSSKKNPSQTPPRNEELASYIQRCCVVRLSLESGEGNKYELINHYFVISLASPVPGT